MWRFRDKRFEPEMGINDEHAMILDLGLFLALKPFADFASSPTHGSAAKRRRA
jgi:hypothetical protein